jgi:hypothetical protein
VLTTSKSRRTEDDRSVQELGVELTLAKDADALGTMCREHAILGQMEYVILVGCEMDAQMFPI